AQGLLRRCCVELAAPTVARSGQARVDFPVLQVANPDRRGNVTVKGGVAMGLIWSLTVGLVAGALAKLAMPGRDPGGIGVTLALGIGGSLLASLFGRATHLYATAGGPGIIASAIGAFVL